MWRVRCSHRCLGTRQQAELLVQAAMQVWVQTHAGLPVRAHAALGGPGRLLLVAWVPRTFLWRLPS
jgi:hypothetical protein